MNERQSAGVAGIVASVLFWLAMLVIGAMRPGYSHSTDAISELGARGTSNAALWNIFGFIVPGLLLAVAGKAIVDSADARQTWAGRLATWSLPAFGVTVAGQGLIPAVMSNGELVTSAWSTRGHLLMSLLLGSRGSPRCPLM